MELKKRLLILIPIAIALIAFLIIYGYYNICISFGKGETESAFETVAFKLETGEISEIIETSVGFHIIKCISTFDREQTDINKVKIVEKRKEEVFGQEYEAFAQTLNKKLNEELWKKISLCRNEEIVTSSFFSVYEQYYEN